MPASPLPDTDNWIGNIESVFFDKNGGKFCSKEHEVTVTVPQGAIKDGIKAELKFGATLFAPVTFANNMLPVSPIIWLCMNVTLQKPVHIQIPHCVNIKSQGQANSLQFAKASHSQSNGNMIAMDGGEFVIGKSYGSIEVDHFCYYCVVNNHYNNNIPDYKYQAVLFQRKQLCNNVMELEICIMAALPTCEQATIKQYDEKEWMNKCIVQSFSFDPELNKVDFVFSEDRFKNEAEVVKKTACIITKTMVDFHEAYKNPYVKDELERKMNMNQYPPRYHYEIVGSHSFFTEPKILGYILKGGKMVTIDGEGEVNGKITIQCLNTTGSSESTSQSPQENTAQVARTTYEPVLIMGDIIRIVIPNIQAEWEDVAYALCYEITTVRTIKEKCNDNPKKCCRELFTDWLSTDHGTSPKTWSTLLQKLNEIEDLAGAYSKIMDEFKKLY